MIRRPRRERTTENERKDLVMAVRPAGAPGACDVEGAAMRKERPLHRDGATIRPRSGRPEENQAAAAARGGGCGTSRMGATGSRAGSCRASVLREEGGLSVTRSKGNQSVLFGPTPFVGGVVGMGALGPAMAPVTTVAGVVSVVSKRATSWRRFSWWEKCQAPRNQAAA